jgi:nitrate reductase delta subunit
MTAYKLLSLLLCYPDAQLFGLRAQIGDAAATLPVSGPAAEIIAFVEATCGDDLEQAQADYVGTFDFNRRASLHVTYPYQGDRRQRGVALLKLRRLYERLGLEPTGTELPDFLPLLLELADMLEPQEARELLGEFRAAIELTAAALQHQGSPYRHLFAALSLLLGPASEEEIADVMRLAAEGPPEEEVGLEPFAPPELMPTGAGASA